MSLYARPLPLLALLAALALLALTPGCVKNIPPPPGADACFKLFQERYFSPASEPALLVNASLSWRQGKKTARVIIDFWGDFGQRLRMDAWSNLGGSLSYILEDEQGIAAFYPEQGKVYTHTDPVLGVRLLGLPFPFSLSHLAELFVGNFTPFVPFSPHWHTKPGPDNGYIFTFNQGPISILALNSASQPLFMEGNLTDLSEPQKNPARWRIAFLSYAEPQNNRPALAKRMNLTLPQDSFGILRIKTRELINKPWSNKAMTLTLPENAQILPLDDVARDWTTGLKAGEAQ